MNVLLIGPPGAGKGTQAEKLVSRGDFSHLSTGDLFRRHIQGNTSLGKRAKPYIDKGNLVPDEITTGMVSDFIQSADREKGILFDGFPRNLSQARALDEILKKESKNLDRVIFLDVSEEEVVERLTGRLWAPKSGWIYHLKNNPPNRAGFCNESGEPLIQREDDSEELVRFRLKIFYGETKPLLNYYERKGILTRFSGKGHPENLFKGIVEILGST